MFKWVTVIGVTGQNIGLQKIILIGRDCRSSWLWFSIVVRIGQVHGVRKCLQIRDRIFLAPLFAVVFDGQQFFQFLGFGAIKFFPGIRIGKFDVDSFPLICKCIDALVEVVLMLGNFVPSTAVPTLRIIIGLCQQLQRPGKELRK